MESLEQTAERNRREENGKVKIAVISDRHDPKTVATLVAALHAKGYQVVPVEEATHTLDDNAIDDFIRAEVNKTKEALRTNVGTIGHVNHGQGHRNTNGKHLRLSPAAKKKLWKDKRKQLGQAAFGSK